MRNDKKHLELCLSIIGIILAIAALWIGIDANSKTERQLQMQAKLARDANKLVLVAELRKSSKQLVLSPVSNEHHIQRIVSFLPKTFYAHHYFPDYIGVAVWPDPYREFRKNEPLSLYVNNISRNEFLFDLKEAALVGSDGKAIELEKGILAKTNIEKLTSDEFHAKGRFPVVYETNYISRNNSEVDRGLYWVSFYCFNNSLELTAHIYDRRLSDDENTRDVLQASWEGEEVYNWGVSYVSDRHPKP